MLCPWAAPAIMVKGQRLLCSPTGSGIGTSFLGGIDALVSAAGDVTTMGQLLAHGPDHPESASSEGPTPSRGLCGDPRTRPSDPPQPWSRVFPSPRPRGARLAPTQAGLRRYGRTGDERVTSTGDTFRLPMHLCMSAICAHRRPDYDGISAKPYPPIAPTAKFSLASSMGVVEPPELQTGCRR